jgi:signal transduction histidine kinase
VTVVLEIPQSSALAASKHIFLRNLALLVISAVIAVLSIWWAADRFILRRVAVMISASRRLAAGDLRARIGPIGIRDELSHLAGVFDEMAESLQKRVEQEERVTASLKQSREQLRRLTTYQNDVREQERIRIAREIHDQFGQSLSILKMDLAWMRKHMPAFDHAVNKKMEAMFRLIDETMVNLHVVTAELRPVILDDFGLAAAIEWQAEFFRDRSGISCRFENDGYEPDLPADQATALFRIFQELLTNIIRHAEADEVIVRLEKHDGELCLQVADNGRGITEDEINSPHAYGLLGIRERLYPLGGRVAFEGRPGQGTRVTIHIPLPKK